jgi:hypothetical protein
MVMDPILHSRLLVLRRNLETVKAVGEKVKDTREGLRRVVSVWTDRRADVSWLLTSTGREAEDLLNSGSGLEGVSRLRLERIRENVTVLQNLLTSDQLEKDVDAINDRWNPLGEELLKEPMETYLFTSAEEKLEQLSALEETFTERSASADAAVRAAAERDAWGDYLKVLPEAEALFSEYVDFLGGLALRDSGYDQGICQLADELLHAIVGRGGDAIWKSFTVPASHEVLDATVARIIRVGFPEWSNWALPLTAYGFFALLVTHQPRYRTFAATIGGDADPRVPVLQADALATYVMGPAYAGALMLFRLDPRGSADDRQRGARLNELRATTVLATLDKLDRDSGSTTCGDVREALERAWATARARTATEAAPGEEAELLRAGAEFPGPPQVEGVDADLGDPQIGKIVDFAARSMTGKEFGDDALDKIAQWAEDLVAGRDLVDDRLDAASDPLRQLLNAAWVARVTGTDADLTRLTEELTKHWTAVEARQAAGFAGSTPSVARILTQNHGSLR